MKTFEELMADIKTTTKHGARLHQINAKASLPLKVEQDITEAKLDNARSEFKRLCQERGYWDLL